MEEKLENEVNSHEKPKNCWKKSEEANLVKIFTIIVDGQKAYGKDISLKSIYAYFKLKLEKRYSVDQVMYALDKYTDEKNDIPSPADIVNILSPKKVKVTYAQHVAALDYQKRNGYSEFSYEARLIRDYNKQQTEANDEIVAENKRLLELSGNPVFKQIEDK